MDFLLDTNVFITYSKHRQIYQRIVDELKLFHSSNRVITSYVTLVEINSIIHTFKIGDSRRTQISELLDRTTIVDISYEAILHQYEQIDAYSLGKHNTLELNTPPSEWGKMIYGLRRLPPVST